MERLPLSRFATITALVLLTGACGARAQTQALSVQAPTAKPSAAVPTLPATQPTATTEQNGIAHAATAPHHVEVEYTEGKLAIRATNAGLNEVLREVSHKTGIKITGGVSDDRVFGSYGPSSPSVVLDALLEGSGSNILLVDDKSGGSQLILTPRRGGATPPSPGGSQGSDSEENASGYYVPPVVPFQAPVANGRGPGAAPDQQGNQPATDEVENNAAKTPQQIYEQLQKAMQQRQALAPPQ